MNMEIVFTSRSVDSTDRTTTHATAIVLSRLIHLLHMRCGTICCADPRVQSVDANRLTIDIHFLFPGFVHIQRPFVKLLPFRVQGGLRPGFFCGFLSDAVSCV